MRNLKNVLEGFKESGYLLVPEIPENLENLKKEIQSQIPEDEDNLLDIENLTGIIVKWKSSIILVYKLLENKKDFRQFLEYMYDDIKAGFEYKVLRTCPVYFKFQEHGEIYSMEIRHFVTNLMFWQGYAELDEYILSENMIFDCSAITAGSIKSYIDDNIVRPYKSTVSNKKMNIILHDILHDLGRISTDFNLIMGLTINLESFIDLAKRNKEFDGLLKTVIPEDMQPSEIESYLDKLTKQQEKILYEEDNVLQPMIRSKTGIKEKQRAEAMINGGMKPDLNGNTIPIPINTNLLYGGLRNIHNYYIDSLGGKKALLMNKKEMGRSGHFARKVNLACLSIHLNNELEDCGTLNPVLIEVKSKKHINKLIGRYYKLPYKRNYEVLTENDTDLIGKKILLRSPITCACKTGVCKKCYGKLVETNNDINIGPYGSTKISEPVSQSILSTKHQLTTDSVKIIFKNEHFQSFFDIYGNVIVLNTDKELDITEYTLVIIKKNIERIEEFSESSFNEFIPLFHVKNNKTGELYEFLDDEGKDLFLTESLKEVLVDKGETLEVNVGDIRDFSELFVLEIENNELTRPLFNLMALMEKSEHDGCSTIDELAQRMIDLLIEASIPAVAVHGEIMLYPLIRSSENILDRPRFNKYLSKNDYDILTLVMSLKNNPSVTISLSSQELMRQIKSPATFKKVKPSLLDPSFRETL